MTEPALIPNPQLTRTGELYPRWKTRILDVIHKTSVSTVPRALSASDTEHCNWAWDAQRKHAVWSRTGSVDAPELHRLIGVLDLVCLDESPAFVTIFPLYLDDTKRVDDTFRGCRRPFLTASLMEDEMVPAQVFLPKAHRPPSPGAIDHHLLHYSHDVRDYTDCKFGLPANLIPPAALHKHDLVMVDVSIHLYADFTRGPAQFVLRTDQIRLVHVASDHAAHLSIEDVPVTSIDYM